MTEGAAVPFPQPRLRERLGPLLTVLVLAPWIGEYLLGNVPGPMLYALPFLAPMYGGGALVVREVAIRARLGWPGTLLLGVSYGIVQAGLVDQSLFNPNFMSLGYPTVTPIPALGISAMNAVAFVMGHAVWSITLSIAFAGFLFPGVARAPWLGRWGWGVIFCGYLGGCWIILNDLQEQEHFMASPAQLFSAAALALLAAALAFILGRRRQAGPVVAPPRPLITGVLAFAISSAMVLAPETWTGFVLKLAIIVSWARAAWVLCRHTLWSEQHSVALASGTLLTYAWLGPVVTTIVHGGGSARYVWNAVFAGVAAALALLSFRTVRRSRVACGS